LRGRPRIHNPGSWSSIRRRVRFPPIAGVGDWEGYGPEPDGAWSFSKVSWYELKVNAIQALGAIADPAGVPALAEMMRAPTREGQALRDTVAGALAAIGSADAIPVLEAVLRDDKTLTGRERAAAEAALAKIKASNRR
jgi:HEAT repeat protein